MPDQPVAEPGPLWSGYQFLEILLNSDGIGLRGELQAIRQTSDMGIHDDSEIEVEGIAQHDIGGLSSDSRKGHQRIHIRGNDSAVESNQLDAGGLDVLCLVSE